MTYLGLDLSTQKLKAIILDDNLETLVSAEVSFDSELPEFRTVGGVNRGSAKHEFHVQPVMWIKALDIVLDRLVVLGVDFTRVVAVSGSAQQHGSIYWSKYGVTALRGLDPGRFLHSQIDDSAFTITRTPVWMDSSTAKQCVEIEEAIGGREEVTKITGSRCYERFTGPQIRKIFQTRPDCYHNTERISLVSSFLASIFIAEIAAIDFSDGSGMNLFDIEKKTWSDPCLNACASDLDQKLGDIVPTNKIVGTIANFFVERYGFSEQCKVVAFTGDNPSAFAGMAVDPDWIVMSLGTSDTIMMELKEKHLLPEACVFVHPTDTDRYMSMICFRNGSLVRESFLSECENSWDKFSELLDSTPRGNFGNLALHFHTKEIIPNLEGSLRWNKTSTSNTADLASGVLKYGSGQTEIRALIEGQMLHRKAVAMDMGFQFSPKTRILVTGGASTNKSILQVISDVFNAPVFVQHSTEAALLGAAYRSKYVVQLQAESEPELDYHSFIAKLLPDNMKLVCEPCGDSYEIYDKMLTRYHEMVSVMSKC